MPNATEALSEGGKETLSAVAGAHSESCAMPNQMNKFTVDERTTVRQLDKELEKLFLNQSQAKPRPPTP